MSDVLKGNFKPKDEVKIEHPGEESETLEQRFERTALKRLGGSIAFVKKQKVHWGDDEHAVPAAEGPAESNDEKKPE